MLRDCGGENVLDLPLSVQNLTHHRGGRSLFSNLSFEVRPGSVLTVSGPNGSGKTTLLKLISGLIDPEVGVINLGSSFHYVGHLNALKMDLTVFENLKMFTHLNHMSCPKGHVSKVLSFFKLDHLSSHYVRTLSAGQRRQVALARLGLIDKKIWILDEPTSHLDDQAMERLWAFVHGHTQKGGAAVIASHDPVPLTNATTLVLNV